MATKELDRDDIGWTLTLSPGVVETVTFSRDVPGLEIVVEGATDPVFYTLDGREPAADGTDSYRIPAGDWVDRRDPPGGTVKLVTAGTATVTVQRGY